MYVFVYWAACKYFVPHAGAIGLPGDRFSGGQSAALNSVSCKGTENELRNCTFDRTSFDHRCEIASVVCQGI